MTNQLNDPEPSLPQLRLLLVDDKESNLIALEATLAGEYDLLFAHSGPEALGILEKEDVAVILLDIQMPGMDGFETARRIKAIERAQHIPIIFVTAVFTENPFIKKGYQAGAVDYFTKPFDPDILRTKVEIYASFSQKQILLKERESRIKEAEELLKAGRKLSGILESLPVGVVIADVEGRVLQINAAVMEIWGCGGSFKSDSYGEFVKWWERERRAFKDAFARILKTGQPIHNEILKITCFDGGSKTILNSASPLRGTESDLYGAVAVIQDITEHQKIGQDMEQRILKLVSLGVELERSAPH